MRAWSFVLLLGFCTAAATGCTGIETTIEETVRARLDPDIPPVQSSLIVDDLQSVVRLPLEVPDGGLFHKTFGGREGKDVLKYLNERIQLVLAETTNPYLLLFDPSIGPNRYGAPNLPIPPQAIPAPSVTDQEPVMIAQNVGIIMWFMSASGPEELMLRFQGREIPIVSSRVGIIRLGSGYSRFPRIDRVASLIHEARHSDCTGGITEADLTRFRRRLQPREVSCGHLHAVCPEGHPYAGTYGCDARAWGAYSVQAAFLAAVRSNCRSCSQTDKQVASAGLLDAISRILVSMGDMERGRHGTPDMSSGGLRQ
jgi:hypothetical protein